MTIQPELLEMVSAMREKAENAYLNGEVATARHLATVALEKWPDGAQIGEISWCFAILLHCYKNDTDYYYLSDRYFKEMAFQKECRFSMDESDDGTFISFLMEILRPTISPDMLNRWRNIFLSMEYPRLKNDISTALLLDTTIEMLCFFGVEDWRTIGEHLAAILEAGNGYVAQEVRQCICRLSIQMHILNSEPTSADELQRLLPQEQYLAHAWELYFQSDFQKLDDLIPELSAAVNCDSEFFLSVQGLVTATELTRDIARGKHPDERTMEEDERKIQIGNVITLPSGHKVNRKEQRNDPFQQARYYRYQRFETERPLSAFLAIREADAKNVSHKLREKNLSEETIASESWEVFRTIPFLWSSALKYWDLSNLIQMYSLRLEFHWASALYFEHGEYHGTASDAVDAIISGIMTVSSEPYKRRDVKQLIDVLGRYGTDADIHRLYDFIFHEAPPVTWNLCVEWLLLLGDLLPEDQMDDCFDWTIRYHNDSEKLMTVLNTEEYYYLHPLFQHYTWTEDKIELLMFHFDQMFQTPPFKSNEFEIVLRFLADNQWEICKKQMEKMLDWKENRQNQGIIINCCSNLVRHNLNTKEFCTALLERRAVTTGCESYQRFAAVIRDRHTIEPGNLHNVYVALQDAINGMTLNGYSSDRFCSVYDHIEGFNWKYADKQEFQSILELALPVLSQEKETYPMYIVNTLQSLCLLFQRCNNDAKQMLAEVLLKQGPTFEHLFLMKHDTPNARETFRICLYRPVYLYNELLFTFCQIYDGLTMEQKMGILAYSVKWLSYYPEDVYYPTYLFLRAEMDDESLHRQAHNGFAQLRIVAAHSSKQDKGLGDILRGLESALDLGGIFHFVGEARDFILDILQIGSGSLLHTTRLRTAKLVKRLLPVWSTELEAAKAQLLKDHRKSIRNVMMEKGPR